MDLLLMSRCISQEDIPSNPIQYQPIPSADSRSSTRFLLFALAFRFLPSAKLEVREAGWYVRSFCFPDDRMMHFLVGFQVPSPLVALSLRWVSVPFELAWDFLRDAFVCVFLRRCETHITRTLTTHCTRGNEDFRGRGPCL